MNKRNQAKACVIHAARDLQIETHGVPVPGRDEVVIRLASGGVCGSDQHDYLHGACGGFAIREPFIPGHAVSGYVDAVGEDVAGLAVGALVAVDFLAAGRIDVRPLFTRRFALDDALSAFQRALDAEASVKVRLPALVPEALGEADRAFVKGDALGEYRTETEDRSVTAAPGPGAARGGKTRGGSRNVEGT